MLGAAIAVGDADLFADALHDRLHEPYRRSEVLASVRSDPPRGVRGATLSGSGPTVIAWADDPRPAADELRARFPGHEVLVLRVSAAGALA
jgi:homoserine kinase